MAPFLRRNRLQALHGACICGEGSGRGRLARRFAAHGQPRERAYAGRTSTDTRWTQRLASLCAGLSRGYPTALAPVRWPVPRAVVAAGVAVIVVAASAAGCGGPVDSEPRPPASPPPATQETPAATQETPAAASENARVLATGSPEEPSRARPTPAAVPEDLSDSAAVPEDLSDSAAVPEDLSDSAAVPEDLSDSAAVPEDLSDSAAVPEDLSDSAAVPEDLSDSAAVPEDLSDSAAVPEDLSDSAAIPEDLSDSAAVPEDLSDSAAVPEDLSDRAAVPEDLSDRAAVPPSAAVSSQDSSPRGGRFADAYTGPSAPAQGPSVAASAQGAEYTWQDGPATRRMLLQLDLVAQPTSENRDDDVVAVDQGELSIVRKQERHERGAGDPVFRTESGHLVTFPGGVLIMLDGEWDAAQVQSFFAGQGIDMSRVEAQTFGPNAFLVSTESGLAAVELANDLAAEEGVVYAVPDRLLGAELE